jgi:hypothetical protein
VCGRRWGESTVIFTLAVDCALTGRNVGIFALTFRFLKPLIAPSCSRLRLCRGSPSTGPCARSASKTAARSTSGRSPSPVARRAGANIISPWSTKPPTTRLSQGHSRSGDAPATLDYKGKIVLASTPNGLERAFWEAANMPERGYGVHHAPTSANPHLPPDEIAYLRSTLRPEIGSQELDALLIDTGGATIFPFHALLIDGEPHSDEGFVCDYVGLAIDSDSGKGGPDRDGCAAVIFALTPPLRSAGLSGERSCHPSRLGHSKSGAGQRRAMAYPCARADHGMVPSPEAA